MSLAEQVNTVAFFTPIVLVVIFIALTHPKYKGLLYKYFFVRKNGIASNNSEKDSVVESGEGKEAGLQNHTVDVEEEEFSTALESVQQNKGTEERQNQPNQKIGIPFDERQEDSDG